MGRKTSVYLNSTQLLRLQALGGPRLTDVVDSGISAMEASAVEDVSLAASQDRTKRSYVLTDGCDHPMSRRDLKSGLCHACGVNVG